MQEQSTAHLGTPATPEQRETRKCRSCYGSGYVLTDAVYDQQTGELVEESVICPICRGSGQVSVYLYPKPRLKQRRS